MTATVSGIHLSGTHAARPAAAGPPAGSLYSCTTDSLIYRTDGTSWATWATLGGVGGSVATDAIWDAAGDLAVGTGANTGARLAVGASGTVPKSNGTTLAYDFPPGHGFDYVAITSSSTTTATTEGTATTAITGTSIAYDGSTVILVEVVVPYLVLTATAAGQTHVVDLYDGATILGRIMNQQSPAAAAMRSPGAYSAMRLTPTAASHQYIVKHWITAGTNGIIAAGVGGTGANLAAYLRVFKAT